MPLQPHPWAQVLATWRPFSWPCSQEMGALAIPRACCPFCRKSQESSSLFPLSLQPRVLMGRSLTGHPGRSISTILSLESHAPNGYQGQPCASGSQGALSTLALAQNVLGMSWQHREPFLGQRQDVCRAGILSLPVSRH